VQPETAVQPDRERCSRRQRFNRRQRGSRRQRCSRRQRGSCESSAATESGASREQTRAAERNQSGPRRDMIVESGWDSRAAERPDEECCQGRAEVREGERHQQGEAGATQAKEAALIRRGRRCHERGEVACYVPDMNLHVGRPSAGARRRKTSARRSRIGASPRSGANSTRTSMPREGEGVMSCPRHESPNRTKLHRPYRCVYGRTAKFDCSQPIVRALSKWRPQWPV